MSSAVCEEIGEYFGICRDKENLFPAASILCGLIPLSSSIPRGEVHQLSIKIIDRRVVPQSGYQSHGINRGGDGSDDDTGEGGDKLREYYLRYCGSRRVIFVAHIRGGGVQCIPLCVSSHCSAFIVG